MNLDNETLEILKRAAATWKSGFDSLPEVEDSSNHKNLDPILQRVAIKLHNNYPYQHPMYLGQMMKPPHPIAHLAYTLAMSTNPNNHALDGGRASSEMEKDAVQQIAEMIGWKNGLGHLCGGGTVANLEALWVSRELTENRLIAVSDQAHYTHSRCASLLGMDCRIIESDTHGRMRTAALQEVLDKNSVGTVVVTLGTTGLGAVDPLEEILALQEQYQFRIHIDSAYGGYFKLAENLSEYATRQYELMNRADSIVIDPHKHGLQPYGCGCVLFKDPAVARVYKHDSPYTYFTSDQLHLGEISLECSRAGASAVALWATLQRFPLEPHGEFSTGLESARSAAIQLYEWLNQSEFYTPVVTPDLDIVVWSVRTESASESSGKAREIFEAAAEANLHFALVTLPRKLVEENSDIQNWDQSELTCLRACVMKPEHQGWMPRILELFSHISRTTLG
ncbi:pyridoxal phosphate-dependent decarboxylase family protein [Thalassoglobus polymorphus]|uniref:L-2,4-diaminobutyrate decarboxylase n=1 Tax=Thalassoglobus polymorphus TaxID=2527994 RepID=A0A517QUZ8_9PLAN|nr:aminotransferase class V-fold PLP-dependent enzyme [Thalassoglobus polymorphus]QDT35458.1 L-2,4-diaminobutyrate decarboxylase [Thalassoglobus polymorphus]